MDKKQKAFDSELCHDLLVKNVKPKSRVLYGFSHFNR